MTVFPSVGGNGELDKNRSWTRDIFSVRINRKLRKDQDLN